VVGFPTDTAYGLGADPFNEVAVDRIFRIKGRAESKPVLILVNSLAMAEALIQPNPKFLAVARHFWPGPLTLIARESGLLPTNLTAGSGTVGMRWPIASFATDLIGRFKRPITATSANRSGMPSTATVEDIRVQLGESLDAIIDGGVLPGGSSTLLDLDADPPVLLREGPISFESLQEFLEGRIRRQVA
jgi:L-threonylcarbamoyladenylate synthase